MQPGLNFAEWMMREHQRELLRDAAGQRGYPPRTPRPLRRSLRRRLFHSLGQLLMAWGASLERCSRLPAAGGHE